MRNPKVLLLAGVLTLLVGIWMWNWISGWGLVTVNFREAPLSKVIKSIERQGGVKIRTNADLSKLVTLRLDRVSPYEAVDTLAVRIEADARLAYVAAPQAGQITEVLAAFTAGTNPGGWYVSSAGGGFGGPGGMGGPVGESEVFIDPRNTDWNVSESTEKTLKSFLSQGSQKTGVLFAVPEAWNPEVTTLPKSGKVGAVSKNLFDLAKGRFEEVFLLTAQAERSERPRNAENEGERRWEFSRTVFSPTRGEGRRGGGNQEWMAERIQAQINNLPTGEREQAQKEYNEMRAFWASVRELPEEERRQKIEEMMNNPEVQNRMQSRMEARDSQRTPQQRENRMRNYNERKQEIKQGMSKS